MNHIYRIVWNNVAACWQVVAETTKSHGKSHSRKRAVRAGALAAGWLLCLPVWAGPTGGEVVAGSATIAQTGSATTINQSSQNAAINWQTFSVGKTESVQFNQPNASAITLNRVTGAESSQILGSLTANGQVFILNPNGVLFGKGAQVNVGGIVASTGRMSDADFMAGNYRITGANAGSVINEGNISAGQGGVIAFIAPVANNTGTLSAPQGSVLLAGAQAVTITLQDGSLVGYTLDQGALQAMADNGGLIQAEGGHVVLTAKGLDALSKATVNHSGIIEAQTVSTKNGVVELLGDMEVGQVNVSGKIDASAPNGGDGGFVETSAAKVKVAESTVIDTRAPQGKTGEWLIDPDGFTIESGANGDIAGNTLTAILSTSNASVVSTNGKGTDGNVNVNESVSWNTNRLRLSATNDININADLNGSGTARLELEYGQGAVASGNTADYHLNDGAKVNLPAGLNFSTKLGSDGLMTMFEVITSLGVEGDTSFETLQGMKNVLNGNYALGANIDASGTAGWNGGAGWEPVGAGTVFFGTFHGLGHTVSGLTINRPTTPGNGLFAYLGGYEWGGYGVIRDIGVLNVNVTGSDSTGALVGETLGGSIYSTYSSGTVSGVNFTGGLIGTVGMATGPESIIDKSHSDCVVNGTGMSTGGLVGFNRDGRIMNSYSSGIVTSSGEYIGGLVGSNGRSIHDSYSTSNVIGGNSGNVGGLAGQNWGRVENSYATGAVSVTSGSWVGGLVGFNSDGDGIIGSFSTSDVTVSSGGPVGGLAGANIGWISNSYSTGNVTGSDVVGGLVGIHGGFGTITNSYSTGRVTAQVGAPSVGGLVGYDEANQVGLVGTISSSYWNTETSGQATSAGGTGLTTAQMQHQSNFTGWDFTNTWRIVEGSSYPLLRSLTQGTITLSLTGTARDIDKVYDGLAWHGGSLMNWGGFIDGDTASSLQGTLTWGGTAQGAINVGEYTLVPSGVSSQKYEIVFVPGTLYIIPKPIDITVSKNYNGNATFTGGFVVDQSDLLPADRGTVTVSGTASVENAGPGSYTFFVFNNLTTNMSARV